MKYMFGKTENGRLELKRKRRLIRTVAVKDHLPLGAFTVNIIFTLYRKTGKLMN